MTIQRLWLYCVVSEAFRGVVVHHSNGLHERVADSRADEPEASFAQLFAHRVGLSGGRRNLAERVEPMPDWSAADKSPYVSVERTEFFPRYQELLGICDCRFDFEPVAYDARVMEETLDVLVVVTRNLRGVESTECLAGVVTLVENRRPSWSEVFRGCLQIARFKSKALTTGCAFGQVDERSDLLFKEFLPGDDEKVESYCKADDGCQCEAWKISERRRD